MQQAVVNPSKNKSDIVNSRHHAGNEEILSSDIIIPRLMLMQGLSDLVSERKASQGDFIRSTTGGVLGTPEKPLSFIPLTFNNQWVLSEKVGKKYEYRSTEPMNASNQDAEWEFKKDGGEWKRTKLINLYALLPSDVKLERDSLMEALKSKSMPDPSTALMPILISFRGTSYNAGKTVVTHFARAKKYGLPAYVSTLTLSCTQETNDLGTYYVMKVIEGGKTTPDDQETALDWYGILAQGKHKIEPLEDIG